MPIPLRFSKLWAAAGGVKTLSLANNNLTTPRDDQAQGDCLGRVRASSGLYTHLGLVSGFRGVAQRHVAIRQIDQYGIAYCERFA